MKITPKDLDIQFFQETGERTPRRQNHGLSPIASQNTYINWLEEKLLEEWNKKK